MLYACGSAFPGAWLEHPLRCSAVDRMQSLRCLRWRYSHDLGIYSNPKKRMERYVKSTRMVEKHISVLSAYYEFLYIYIYRNTYVMYVYGGFLSHGGTQNHPVVMNHDLVRLGPALRRLGTSKPGSQGRCSSGLIGLPRMSKIIWENMGI